jgi:hypothetical protein
MRRLFRQPQHCRRAIETIDRWRHERRSVCEAGHDLALYGRRHSVIHAADVVLPHPGL